MNIRADQLAQQVSSARARGWAPIMRKAEKRHDLPAGLLLALASRETDMEDVVGDKGHGRGLFQIDDRFHADWLAAHGAPGQATTPRVEDAADFAASMLASNLAFARAKRDPRVGSAPIRLLRLQRRSRRRARGPAERRLRQKDDGRRLRPRRARAIGRDQAPEGRPKLAGERRPHPPQGRPGPGRRPAQATAADVVRPHGSRRVADVPSQAGAGVRCRAEHRRP